MKAPITARSVLSLAVTFGLLTFTGTAPGEEAALIEQCQHCHGKDGVSQIETVPTIAGNSDFVLADYLYAYRDDARSCDAPEQKAMCILVAKLTDDQIESLAGYFSGMPFKAAVQAFDADKAALGAAIHAENCAKCHTDGGSNPEDDASLLAGQWIAYLKNSLSEFRSASREQSKAMQRKTERLSESDIDALAHYYASQQ